MCPRPVDGISGSRYNLNITLCYIRIIVNVRQFSSIIEMVFDIIQGLIPNVLDYWF